MQSRGTGAWCGNWTSAIEAQYREQLGLLHAKYPSLPTQASERNHCYAWYLYAEQPNINALPGIDIRMNVNVTYHPAQYVNGNWAGYFAGTHLIIEVIEGQGLDDEARIQQAFRDCVTSCGATLLHIHTHKFSPQGVSGVAVLAESHISVHTWPEIGYGAFDVFMCGGAQPWRAVDVLRRAFSAREVRVKELLRGEGLLGATG